MRKLLMSYIILSTFGIADGKSYTQADRILDMQKMAQAMQDIQSGFFYNNLDIVKAGAEDLKKTIVKIGPIDSELHNKDVYERWLNNNTAMTKRIQRDIKSRAEVIVKRFGNGDPREALQEYSKITGQCMKCHVRLRKW
jgi:hypothetical protein